MLAYHVTDPGIIIYLTRGKEIVKALFKPIARDDLDNLVLKVRKPLEIVPGRDNFDEKLKSFDLGACKETLRSAPIRDSRKFTQSCPRDRGPG